MATRPDGHGIQTVAISRDTYSTTATIANGASASGSVRSEGMVLAAIALPAAWTAAALTFEVSFDDGTTWYDLYDDQATEVSISSANMTSLVGKAVTNSAVLEKLAAVPMFRLISGTSSAAVNQGADRTFTVYLKG